MSSYFYTISSEHSTETRDHYHSVAISDINAAVAQNIPRNAKVTGVAVCVTMHHESIFGTLGNADLNIWFCNNGDDNKGHNLYSGKTSTEAKLYYASITDFVSKEYPFSINTSYSRLAVFYASTTKRRYQCKSFYISYTYEIEKTNKIYVGTTQPKEIYIGTTPVKSIYIGTTKVYG